MLKPSIQLSVTWPGKFLPDGTRSTVAVPKPVELVRVAGENQPVVYNASSESVVTTSTTTLIHGDCLAIAGTLIRDYANACQLIYLDPPFNSGRAWTDNDTGEVAYDDRWGDDANSFAHFVWQRLTIAKNLLTPTGSIFLHGSDRESPLLRALLDDVFGHDHYVNQIIWHYTGGGRAKSRFSNKHDVILWYRNGDAPTFYPDAIRVPYKPTSGFAKGGIRAKSGKTYAPNPLGTIPDDVWDIPMVNPMSPERTAYPTQKPLALLERIIAATTLPGDTVTDLFCGSGTTLVAAQGLRRKAVGVDQGLMAVQTAAGRLGLDGWWGRA